MSDTLALKVAARFLALKSASLIGDPKEFLRDFEGIVNFYEKKSAEISEAKGKLEKMIADPTLIKPGYGETVNITSDAYFSAGTGAAKLSTPGHQLFLAILQTYTLPPALRKKIEVASRTYLKRVKPRVKEHGLQRNLEYVTIFEKWLATSKAHLALAKEALEKGKAHSEEGEEATKLKAGPFTLVNTGGFSKEQMSEVAEVVEKAASLAKSSGLGQVCYGEVQVTNTINKSNVLAFYLIANDELFVRANIKGSSDVLQTILHELGHRFEWKFMAGKKRAIENLYHQLAGQEIKRRDTLIDKKNLPQPGETMVSKGKTYVVTQTLSDYKKGYKIVLQQQGKEIKPEYRASISLEGWLASKEEGARNIEKDPNYIGYVSNYAKKGGPSENFAEMFSYYILGTLPVLQSAPFENLVFGV